MRTLALLLSTLCLVACADERPPHIPPLLNGEHRGSNSGEESMAPHNPTSWLRAVVLASRGEWECSSDGRNAASCVDWASRHIDIACRLSTECELSYYGDYAGDLTASISGETWRLYGTWGDQGFQAVRDGAGAFISVRGAP